MDYEVFATAFIALFLAEMGDKTQLAVLTLTASTKKPIPVFLGSALALILVTGLGTVFGEGVARFVPVVWLNKGASLLFIVIGLWMWVKA